MASEIQKEQSESPADPMRNGVRFPLRLKVRVESEQGAFDAETEDISASGVLFRTQAEAPAIDAQISWTMVLPRDTMGATTDTVVHCIGRVIWRNAGESGQQVGVVIDSYRIAGGVK